MRLFLSIRSARLQAVEIVLQGARERGGMRVPRAHGSQMSRDASFRLLHPPVFPVAIVVPRTALWWVRGRQQLPGQGLNFFVERSAGPSRLACRGAVRGSPPCLTVHKPSTFSKKDSWPGPGAETTVRGRAMARHAYARNTRPAALQEGEQRAQQVTVSRLRVVYPRAASAFAAAVKSAPWYQWAKNSNFVR